MTTAAARLTALSALALALAAGCNRQPLETAPALDLARFEGKWFDVAHLPRPTQRDCVGTTATYTRQPDGRISFVHECTLADGSYHGATAMARVPDATQPAKMEVDFGGFTGDYWVLEVASDYRYAVVGHPSRDYLWILSRTPTMTRDDLSSVLAHADQRAFDTSKLEFTPQNVQGAQGTPAPATDYGCAVGGGAGGASSFVLGALGVASVLRRRRRA